MKHRFLHMWVLNWADDKWDSKITNDFLLTFTYSDKLGHFLSHFALTLAMYFFLDIFFSNADICAVAAIVSNLTLGLAIEVVDGCRPRRHAFEGMKGDDRICFYNQADYETRTIEGFSIKDAIANIAGTAIALAILVWAN